MNVYQFNEHDENQVQKILKNKKKKKLKRKVKIVLFLIITVCVIGLLKSSFFKVKSLTVEGLHVIEREEILQKITIHKNTYFPFINEEAQEKNIHELPRVKDVKISCDWFGNVLIRIQEADAIAYAKINEDIYEINNAGHIIQVNDSQRINELKRLTCVNNFKDEKLLERFAEEYKEVSDLMRNYMSDILLKPLPADETLLECLLTDNNILYVRIEDLSKRLGDGGFDYEAHKTKYPHQNILSIEGRHVYSLPEKK